MPRKNINRFHYLTQDLDGVSHAELCRDACMAGVRWVQFRSKNLEEKERQKQAIKCREITREFKAVFVVNDYVGLASDIAADGVHLGKGDMPIEEARKCLGEQVIIGGTSNSLADVKALLDTSADYIGCGPFSYTKTKDNISEIIGLQGYKDILLELLKVENKLPIIAIGGIKKADICQLSESGLNGVAVSGAINLAANRVGMAREFLVKMEQWTN